MENIVIIVWFPIGKQHASFCWAILCHISHHGPLTRYVKLWIAHAPGMSGTFSPPPRVSNPDVHHGTCVTHVPWCMPGSLTSGFLWIRWRRITGACATRNFTFLARGPYRVLNDDIITRNTFCITNRNVTSETIHCNCMFLILIVYSDSLPTCNACWHTCKIFIYAN